MSEKQEHEKSSQPAKTAVAEKTRPSRRNQPKPLDPYHVILLNDDDHSYAYVIEMLHELFRYPFEKGMVLAQQVDNAGRAIVFTTHRELAELKRDQIHAYGVDARVATCAGSMSAVVQPAE